MPQRVPLQVHFAGEASRDELETSHNNAMHVAVYEDNLMWSAKLMRTLKAFEHDAKVFSTVALPPDGADVAIVNLGSERLPPSELVPLLRGAGIYVIGHAGHKEKELHRFGEELGCDYLATNSELTFKLPDLLANVPR